MKPKCSFRIIGLSEGELSSVIDGCLQGVAYKVGTNHRDRRQKVLRIDIDENTSPELLACLIGEMRSGMFHDFYVSVVTKEDSAVVEIPAFVLDLYKRVGGVISFSYTCVGNSGD